MGVLVDYGESFAALAVTGYGMRPQLIYSGVVVVRERRAWELFLVRGGVNAVIDSVAVLAVVEHNAPVAPVILP